MQADGCVWYDGLANHAAVEPFAANRDGRGIPVEAFQMRNDQTFMGIAVVAICAAGWWHARWFLSETKKGQRLVRWFGRQGALRVFRSLMIAGAVFGALLAAGIINPIR
ncbi:MAG TPA: hypothetical protein EYP14_07900 [Planctomycetaceae bacterium]|nr:hypothetical protein [Planctomycetaceae bacterium]